jgi:sugar phosphate permease
MMMNTATERKETNHPLSSLPFHYGWVIVGVCFFIVFSCLGLARYAYTMLLPSMQAGLGLPYDKMGFIGTGNFCGYLLSVVFVSRLIRRFKPRSVITGGLIIITLSQFGMSFSHGFLMPLTLYFMIGIGSGFANIPTFALASFWFRSDQRGKAAGLMIAGMGTAIVLAGVLVPFLNRSFGADGWRVGWQLMSAIALIVTILAAVLVRNHPAEYSLPSARLSVQPWLVLSAGQPAASPERTCSRP